MKKIIEEMELFKKSLVSQREVTMMRIEKLDRIGDDGSESRDFMNRLMTHIRHLNNNISLIEYDIKDIERSLERDED